VADPLVPEEPLEAGGALVDDVPPELVEGPAAELQPIDAGRTSEARVRTKGRG
jgi:hypothetical protein